ncbi:MAG TPA: efflux RND transporter periplasmic adaptor subunit [Treponemataceae bacterium]|nr:efflux RND transporter periplasmic adaptor subunit [Treponemataceae bacterium]
MIKTSADRIIQLFLLAFIFIFGAAILVAVFTPDKADAQKAPAAGNASPAEQKKTPGASGGDKQNAITVAVRDIAPADIEKAIRINGDVASRSEISIYADASGKLVDYKVGPGAEIKKGGVIALVDPSRPGSPFAVSPVRSTIDGTVISLPYKIGETISVSSPVAKVGVIDELELITFVPEKYVAVLRSGLKASVALVPFPGEAFSARVARVSPVVDSVSRTVEAVLVFDAKDERLKPGMFAAISLVTEKRSGVCVVPRSALRIYNGETVVYTVDADSKARRVRVSTGLMNDKDAEIVSGLSFGDAVIYSGSVSEGTPIRRVAEGIKS